MTTFHITGLTCPSCQKLITKRILTIPDVVEVTVELTGKTTITAPREILKSEVDSVLTGTHYAVETT